MEAGLETSGPDEQNDDEKKKKSRQQFEAEDGRAATPPAEMV